MAASTGVKSRGLWLLLTLVGAAVSVMFVLIPIDQDLKEGGFYIGIALALIGVIKAIFRMMPGAGSLPSASRSVLLVSRRSFFSCGSFR